VSETLLVEYKGAQVVVDFALLPQKCFYEGDCFEFYGIVEPVADQSRAPIGCKALLATAIPSTDLDIIEDAALLLLEQRHAHIFAKLQQDREISA